MKICFFSTEGIENLNKQQYSLQDINIIKDLGYNIIIASKFSDIPWDCDLYFSWWASGSILPLLKYCLRNKPIFVIAGGTEVMLHYDSFYNIKTGFWATQWYKKIATILTLKFASEVFVVSSHMINDVIILSNRIPNVIYNSVDVSKFKINVNINRIYITTVVNFDKPSYYNKRLEIFLRIIPLICSRLPNQKFRIIIKINQKNNKLQIIFRIRYKK